MLTLIYVIAAIVSTFAFIVWIVDYISSVLSAPVELTAEQRQEERRN